MLIDTHTHSLYSFDGHASPMELCAAAESAGIGAFVITDHYDVDGIMDGFYPDYDMAGARAALEAAQTAYAGRVSLFRGIELGQPSFRAAEAQAFLRAGQFDFVIGSLHNLENVPDFSFLQFADMPQTLMESLYRRMLSELCGVAAFPGVDTVAHLTYPLRYMARGGKTLDLTHFESELRRLFTVMRESGTALELNVKGIRQGSVSPQTELYLLRLWHDCGGRGVTLGSDAHRVGEMGVMLAEGQELLRTAGFTHILFPTERGVMPVELSL